MISQAIAFNLFLAFFPTLLIVVGFATSGFGGRISLLDFISDFTKFLPPGSQQILSEFLIKQGSGAWKLALVGSTGTLLAGSQVMKLLMEGIHAIYGDLEKPGFLHRQLRGLLLLLFVWGSDLDAPRHLFPFFLLVPLGIAALWACAPGWVRLVAGVGLILVLANNVFATAQDAHAGKPSVRELLAALDARGVRFVYTDYAIAYPLVFLSHERVIASPAAGPTNVDRYPPYTHAVAASPCPAYVFRRGSEASAVFVREMRRVGIAFSREALSEFDVYVPERHVDPHDLALLRRF